MSAQMIGENDNYDVLRQVTFEQMIIEIAELNEIPKEKVESEIKTSISDNLTITFLSDSNLNEGVEDYITSTTYLSGRQQFTVTAILSAFLRRLSK